MESLVKEIKNRYYSEIHEIYHLTITQEVKLDHFPEGLIKKED